MAAECNDDEESAGSLRARETGAGWLDRFVSGTLAVQTCPLKPAAYVRRCGVRFEVVRGDGVHVTRWNETRTARLRQRPGRTTVRYWPVPRYRTLG